LKAITGERPRCQFCGKPLRPDTSTVALSGHLQEAPDESTFAPEHRYHRDRVFRLTHRTDYAGRPITGLSFWRGTYSGYGTGQDGTRLFCSYPCGLQFGVTCWNAGMRIKERKEDASDTQAD